MHSRKMVSLLSNSKLWQCYNSWMHCANQAYCNWYRIVEVATDPGIQKTVAAYQELGHKEDQFLEEMENCYKMASFYLGELVDRGLVKQGMIQ